MEKLEAAEKIRFADSFRRIARRSQAYYRSSPAEPRAAADVWRACDVGAAASGVADDSHRSRWARQGIADIADDDDSPADVAAAGSGAIHHYRSGRPLSVFRM